MEIKWPFMLRSTHEIELRQHRAYIVQEYEKRIHEIVNKHNDYMVNTNKEWSDIDKRSEQIINELLKQVATLEDTVSKLRKENETEHSKYTQDLANIGEILDKLIEMDNHITIARDGYSVIFNIPYDMVNYLRDTSLPSMAVFNRNRVMDMLATRVSLVVKQGLLKGENKS